MRLSLAAGSTQIWRSNKSRQVEAIVQPGGRDPKAGTHRLPFDLQRLTLRAVARTLPAFILTLLLGEVTTVAPCQASVESELEAGFVFAGRNDVRIPGSGGTAISFSADLKTDPA